MAFTTFPYFSSFLRFQIFFLLSISEVIRLVEDFDLNIKTMHIFKINKTTCSVACFDDSRTGQLK